MEESKLVAISGKKGEGSYAVVDLSVYDQVAKHKWHLDKGYPERTFYKQGEVFHEKLHHFIIGKPNKGFVVDHINGDKLDNRSTNLRICTQRQNTLNRGICSKNTSGYKGVSYSDKKKSWSAYITANGKRKYIGYFSNAEDAARAYDYHSLILHGEYGFLNFPEEVPSEPIFKNTKTSTYKGVSWSKKEKLFIAKFNFNKKCYYVGGFKTEKEAAKAYNAKVKEVMGDLSYQKLIDIKEDWYIG